MTAENEDASREGLDPSEAAPLLMAWIAWLFGRHGIRYLFVKGPSLAHHGLRAARTSGDVDILVNPAHVARAVECIRQAGWEFRPATYAQAHYSEHSVSLLHPTWPLDVDLHSFFPGFLEAPDNVFAVLWGRRAEMNVLGMQCPIPDRLSSALILALHSLRGLAAEPRHRREMDALKSHLHLDSQMRAELLRLAVATGCDASLASFLSEVGITFVPSRGEDDPQLRAWIRRVQSPSRSVHMWSRLVGGAPGAQKLRVIGRALWPTARDLDIVFPPGPGERGPRRRLVLRVRRLVRGVPVIVGILAEAIRGWALSGRGRQRG